MSLDKTKLVTADLLSQATAMGVHLNEQDAEVRDRLMREVIENEKVEPTLESPIDIEDIPDEELPAGERVEKNVRQEERDKFMEPELPDELKEMVEAPDFEQMAQDELDSQRYAPEAPEPEHTRFEDYSYQMSQPTAEESWEELDQEVLEERKKRIAAEKKAAYYENLRVKSEQRRWASEAKQYFPLCGSALDAGQINAKSRKEFLRQAKSAHERVLPYIKEAIALRDSTLDAERAKVREETREEFIRAWGRATTGPSGYPARADDYKDELADSRRKGDLARSIGILRKRAENSGKEGDL
jgi:hypothetical protein